MSAQINTRTTVLYDRDITDRFENGLWDWLEQAATLHEKVWKQTPETVCSKPDAVVMLQHLRTDERRTLICPWVPKRQSPGATFLLHGYDYNYWKPYDRHVVGCWHCDACKRGRRGKIIQRGLLDSARSGSAIMLTLTFERHLGLLTEHDMQREVVKFWDVIRRRAKRWLGIELGFYRAWEDHKDGTPHVHMIVFGLNYAQMESGILTEAEIANGDMLATRARNNTPSRMFHTSAKGAVTHHHPLWVHGRFHIAPPADWAIAYVVKYATKGIETNLVTSGITRRFAGSRSPQRIGTRAIPELLAMAPERWEMPLIEINGESVMLPPEIRELIVPEFKALHGFEPEWCFSQDEIDVVERYQRQLGELDEIQERTARDAAAYFRETVGVNMRAFEW